MQTYKWETIDHHIGQVERDAGKLQTKIHALGVSIALGWQKDPKRADEAAAKLTALTRSSPYHAKAFAVWVQQKLHLNYSEETEAFYAQKNQKVSPDVFKEARDTPFWELKPASKPKALNIFDQIDRIISAAERHQKKPVEGDVIDLEALRELRELAKKRAAA